mgnify:FL=1
MEDEEIKFEAEYFFDSYAIIEILKENPNYKRFADESVTLTILNLSEIYYSVLNDYPEEKADKIYEVYKKAVVELSDEIIKEAMKFRKKNKKRGLSYADCIGYVYALKHKMKFLTGDKEFKDLNNVEFVKK